MSFERPQIFGEIKFFAKIIKNQQTLVFCDNSIDISLVFILKYIACKFYGCTTVFGNEYILNLKKKIQFF